VSSHRTTSSPSFFLLPSTHPCNQVIDDVGLEDETERNPIEEPQQRLEGGLDQRSLLSLLQHLRTQLEDLRELSTHLVLEVLGLGLGHLFRRVVEDLFREEFEDDHVVFAEREGGFGRGDDLNEAKEIVSSTVEREGNLGRIRTSGMN